LGGEKTVKQLDNALLAKNVDAGILARSIANPHLMEMQAYKLLEALDRLSAGREFPPALMQRMKVQGALRMTTGMAGTGSTRPELAQAAAYEVYASAALIRNPRFPIYFKKEEIASYHYRFQHNRIFSKSETRSFEGDVVISQKTADGTFEQTFIDFKHTMPERHPTRRPDVSADQLERIEKGLMRGVVDRAIFVSNRKLNAASEERVAAVNRRIAEHNAIESSDIPLIETFVQPWRYPDAD